MDPIVVELDFDLDADYAGFIFSLRAVLADHPERENYIATYGAWLMDHPLLPLNQSPRPPARWIHVNLTVEDEYTSEAKRITIALRDDNVYFMGFKNGDGDWYEFGIEGRSMRHIAGSTFLGCECGYASLIDQPANLLDMNLSKDAVAYAVHRLSTYQQVGRPDHATRRDLARLTFIICEAARMTPHYETVRQGWNNMDGSRISHLHVGYIVQWGLMSRRLMNHGDRSPENFDRQGALAVVKLILNSEAHGGRQRHQQQILPTSGEGGSRQQGPGHTDPRRPPQLASRRRAASGSKGGGGTQQQQQQQHGQTGRSRPLLEVLSTEADFHVSSTIAVFDGKRGQIIYKKAQDDITGELDKLNIREHHNGRDQAHTTTGSGLDYKEDSLARSQ